MGPDWYAEPHFPDRMGNRHQPPAHQIGDGAADSLPLEPSQLPGYFHHVVIDLESGAHNIIMSS